VPIERLRPRRVALRLAIALLLLSVSLRRRLLLSVALWRLLAIALRGLLLPVALGCLLAVALLSRLAVALRGLLAIALRCLSIACKSQSADETSWGVAVALLPGPCEEPGTRSVWYAPPWPPGAPPGA
jgi:hypothetical protein